jgi:hypothetical protein
MECYTWMYKHKSFYQIHSFVTFKLNGRGEYVSSNAYHMQVTIHKQEDNNTGPSK